MALDPKVEGTVSGAIGLANRVADTAQVVAKVVNSSSVTRLAKDSVFQFPMFVSAAIDTDETFIITKNVERNYAALMTSVVSLYGYVNLEKEGSLVKYLRKFHSNGNLGPLMTGGVQPGTESMSDTGDIDPTTIILESSTIDTTSEISDLGLSSMWDSVTESLDTGRLNDVYQPYVRTETKLRNALSIAKESIATEASDPKDPNWRDSKFNAASNFTDASKELYTNIPSKIPELGKNAITKADETSTMAPTIINLQFVVASSKNNNPWMQTVVIGVKGMTRRVKSSSMIANMVEACKNNAIFKFIDWTKGERSTLGMVLGADKYKEGRQSVEKDTHWMKVLRHRKYSSLVQKAFGRSILPNATIILTEQEAYEIKNQCGMDIHDPSIASKIIKKYFLLGIGIYDTENKVLDIIYDGDSAFNAHSLRAMVAENKKETNLLAMNKF